jgi:hypothetical protein
MNSAVEVALPSTDMAETPLRSATPVRTILGTFSALFGVGMASQNSTADRRYRRPRRLSSMLLTFLGRQVPQKAYRVTSFDGYHVVIARRGGGSRRRRPRLN